MNNVIYIFSLLPLPKITALFCRIVSLQKVFHYFAFSSLFEWERSKEQPAILQQLVSFEMLPFHTLGYHLHIDDALSCSVLCFVKELFSPFFSSPHSYLSKNYLCKGPISSSLSCPPHITPWLKAEQLLSLAFCRGVGPLTTANIRTAIKASLEATIRKKRKSWGKPDATGRFKGLHCYLFLVSFLSLSFPQQNWCRSHMGVPPRTKKPTLCSTCSHSLLKHHRRNCKQCRKVY